MSAERIRKITETAAGKLLLVKSPADIQAVFHAYLAGLSDSLAETLFLHVKADPRFTDPEINALILGNLERLTDNVSESLCRFGFTDPLFEEASRDAAGSAFLDRLETLFDVGIAGGAA